MSKIDYEKILNQLIKEHPHALDKIKQVIEEAQKDEKKVTISFSDIIKNKNWTTDEKYELLKLHNYNPFYAGVVTGEFSNSIEIKNTFEYIVKKELKDLFVAAFRMVLNCDEDFYKGKYSTLLEDYRIIFDIIASNCDKSSKISVVDYYNLAINITPEEILKKVFKTRFDTSIISHITNTSIFDLIIKTQDIDLIKRCLNYIDDINLYWELAIQTGNTHIINLFIKNGADVNFTYKDRIIGYLSPLKLAIKYHNYAIYEILKANGAILDLHFNEPDFNEKVMEWNDDLALIECKVLEKFEKEPNNLETLKYRHCSSPLEYATKLSSEPENYIGNNNISVNFIDYSLNVHIGNSSLKLENHAKIIDDIFEHIDKKNVNFTDLLASTLTTRNVEYFKKYSKYIIDNTIKVDLDKILELYFTLYLHYDEPMLEPFLEFIGHFEEKGKNYLQFLKEYEKCIQYNYCDFKTIRIDNGLKSILNLMDVKERREVPLITYCRDLDTLKALENYGYDINQVDENGNNVLINLLKNRNYCHPLNKKELVLFNYLLEHIDLSHKTKEGYNALYYLINIFDCEDEWRYSSPDKFGPKNNLELCAAKLIRKMNSEDVCNDSILSVIEKRVTKLNEHNGGKMYLDFVYQHHKQFFDCLMDKGFKLSDTIYANLFSALYPTEENGKKTLEKRIDVEKARAYLFKRLDRDTEIQTIDINKNYEEIITYLDSENASFEEFIRLFIDFNNNIVSLNTFYKEHILKKYKPEKYLEYAKDKYNTVYKDLDSLILKIIIKALMQFPDEDIDDILAIAPNFDINYKIENADIGYSYWTYYADIYPYLPEDEDELEEEKTDSERFEAECIQSDDYENVRFYGGLVQFAILTNNVELAKKLKLKGAEFSYIDEDGDHSWNYISSKTMQLFLESILGKREYIDFSNEDKAYYLGLVNSIEKK